MYEVAHASNEGAAISRISKNHANKTGVLVVFVLSFLYDSYYQCAPLHGVGGEMQEDV